jgi:pilus assembly protein CpaB
MNEKGFTAIFLSALLLAGLATLGVYRFLAHRAAEAEGARLTTSPVVVAAADIAQGDRLTATSLQVNQFASGTVPEGAFSDPDSVVGRVVSLPIFAGEPVIASKLAPIGAAGGLEVKIEPGYRAMAIPVNETVGISGLIQPNSRVDVIVTFRPEGQSRERVAKLFLQNMRVLSVGQNLRRGEDGKPITANTVTLEVTPEQAEMLAVAMNEGVLQLALRGFGDPDTALTRGAAPANVLAAARKVEPRTSRPAPRPRPAPEKAAPPPAPVVEEPAVTRVQIIRGTKLTEKEVQKADSSSNRQKDRGNQER